MTGIGDYCVHGLRVRSEIDLPEVRRASAPGVPDVEVKLGMVDDAGLDDGPMNVTGRRASFAIAGTARYAIEDGSTIVVEPVDGAPARNVRLFLLGSAMGALIHQRGLLPLHASAIMVGDKAIVFMGHSGAGKSTLAAWFHDRGHIVLGDDVCVVRGTGDRPTISAGLQRVRLWKNTLEATGRDHSAYPPSYAGLQGSDKYDVTFDGQRPPEADVELAAIYELAKGEGLEIWQRRGSEAADAVIANTYRGEYVALVGNVRGHWESCIQLVQRTPVFRLERPWDLETGAHVAERILEHAVGMPKRGVASAGETPP